MTFLKYLSLLAISLPLLGSPVRAEDKTLHTQAKTDQMKHDMNNNTIQNLKGAPPKGSTGPTVPPNPVGNTMIAPKLGGSTGPTVPPKPTQGNINR
jgi:hypothetical protein